MSDSSANNCYEQLPLCVDMDGTLLRTDTLWEACLRLISQRPFLALLMPFWLVLGKAGFKHKVSQYVRLDPQSLPYTTGLLEYLSKQKLKGRHLVLVTAATRSIAEGVAEHLKIFNEVLASDAQHNLSGRNKAALLCERFGEQGFVYAGNAWVDLKVWRHAAAAIVVNARNKLFNHVRAHTPIEANIEAQPVALPKALFKAMRIHQWAKNLLIFAALVLSHNWFQVGAIEAGVVAFFAFSFAASAIYLINDLIDLEADRAHPHKQHRPFASGALPLQWGVMLIPLLLAIALLLAWQIDARFISVLLIYLVLTTAYSLALKQIVLLDVITLTILYTIRIIAGAVAIKVPLSYWLIAFSMFIFLSLALVKRFSELQNLIKQGKSRSSGRGYHVDDLPAVSLFGISSGYLAVMVLVLYIHDLQADQNYSHPDWLWLVSIAIMFWISRIWLLAHRGRVHEDPVLFALHDRPSYVVSLLVAISMFLAL